MFPAGFAVGGWKTAGKWTRHLPYFDARIVWCAALVLCGLALGLLVALAGGGSAESLTWAIGFVGAGVVLAFLVQLLCARCNAWKRGLMTGELAVKE